VGQHWPLKPPLFTTQNSLIRFLYYCCIGSELYKPSLFPDPGLTMLSPHIEYYAGDHTIFSNTIDDIPTYDDPDSGDPGPGYH